MTATLRRSQPRRPISALPPVRAERSTLSRFAWKDLWQRFGLYGLIDLHRRSQWFDELGDEELARQLIAWSLEAGYDPVSGLCGEYDKNDNTFVADLND